MRRASRGTTRARFSRRGTNRFYTEIAAMGPKFWIDCSHYRLSSGVASWIDIIQPNHRFDAVGTRVPKPAKSGTIMKGRPFATFAATNWYQSNAAASAWDFASNGSGFTGVYVVRRTAVGNCLFHATQAGGARSTGFDWNYDGVSSNLALGTNATVNSVAIAINTDRCIAHTYDGVNGRTFSNGVQVATGAQAPFAGAVEAMSMGGDVNGQFTAAMYWSASIWFPRVLTAVELTRLAAICARVYGTS